MDYNRRSELLLSAGIAQNIDALRPEKQIPFEHFRYAGNTLGADPAPEVPMLGRWTDGMHYEPMEFGYDLTDLTFTVDRTKPLKYFFIVKTKTDAIGTDADYLPDWMTLRDLTGMFRDFYEDFDEAKAREMFSSLGLDEKERLKALSKGNREKTQLVLTMSRAAKLYLLDEPIGGVDPAARDYILRTIIGNYSENGTVLLSTHLIADVESVLDEVVFLKQGRVLLHENADALREEKGKSVDAIFREVFAC